MNNAELAILGLLAEKPRHGYQLERLVQQRNMRDWADLALSTIYYTLKQLQKKAWLSTRPGEPGQRGRTIYELTPPGATRGTAPPLKPSRRPAPAAIPCKSVSLSYRC